MTGPLGWTEPRDLPVEHIQPGDQVQIHTDQTGPLWVEVITALECDDEECPVGGTCGGVLEYPAVTVHYDALSTLTVRIPARIAVDTAPTGPAPGERVYVSTARAGIPMHQLQRDNTDATACGRSVRTGMTLLAAQARQQWDSAPCERCWPGATS